MADQELEQLFEQMKTMPVQERLGLLVKLSKERPDRIDELWHKVQDETQSS